MGVIKLIKHDDAVNAIMSCNSRAMSGFDWIRRAEALQNLDDIQGEERKSGTWIDRGKDMVLRWQCPECGVALREDTNETD